jgi:hypothetical protein
MTQGETERLRPLYEKAKEGGLKAGKELIMACRRGMLEPDWEDPPKLDRKAVESHLQKREGIGSGRALR